MFQRKSAVTTQIIMVDELCVHIVRKSIKHMYLHIKAPEGTIELRVPHATSAQTIHRLLQEKKAWMIAKQQRLIKEDLTSKQVIEGEVHYFRDDPYKLHLVFSHDKPKVVLNHDRMLLYTKPDASYESRKKTMHAFYKQHVYEKGWEYIRKWEPILGVHVTKVNIQRMKTKWGTCTPSKKTIKLNEKLAHKSDDCLEYVVVHEMVHLLEASHNQRFKALMSHYLPHWKRLKHQLLKRYD